MGHGIWFSTVDTDKYFEHYIRDSGPREETWRGALCQIQYFLGEHKNEFLVQNGNEIRKVSHTFNRVVQQLGLNNGITDRRQKVVFHTLRHTYASWLVQTGVDLYTVQKLMGHSNISMTERYAHLGENTFKKAVKNLERSLANGK